MSAYSPAPFRLAMRVGAGDLLRFLVGQFAVDAVDHVAHLAGIDEERLAGAVAERWPFFLVCVRNQMQAGIWVLVEELAGEGDHALHEVGLDEGAADVAFADRSRDYMRAIGEDERQRCRCGAR